MLKKEFDGVLERYLTKGHIYPEEREALSDTQALIIEEIRRAKSRIKQKQYANQYTR